MSPRYLLDTDSVSYALRGQGSVGARVVEHKPSELCVSAITLAELRYGADRRSSRKLHRLIDAFTGSLEVIPFDGEAARHYGRIASELAARGSPIGEIDTLIAAQAMSLQLTLVTNNVKHFSRIGELEVENWA